MAPKSGMFFIPEGCNKPDNTTDMDWLGGCVREFRNKLSDDEEAF
ncbi:hypothetical protein [Marinobacter sp. G11]|nr:hypothetical protein [Marinobacter sp. G11]